MVRASWRPGLPVRPVFHDELKRPARRITRQTSESLATCLCCWDTLSEGIARFEWVDIAKLHRRHVHLGLLRYGSKAWSEESNDQRPQGSSCEGASRR
jgi:hypothetical protein